MPADFIVIIPARYASTRLPGKPLLRIGTQTLLENVYNSAAKSDAKAIYVATDDQKIVDEVNRFGGDAILTASNLMSGTDRLQAASVKLNLPARQVIVNLQGDEYNFNPDFISQVANSLVEHGNASIATLCQEIISHEEIRDPNVVKVVRNQAGYALYFSRAVIPWSQTEVGERNTDTPTGYKHIGIYAYHSEFLNTYVNLDVPDIECKESLEQLRAMYHGYNIYVQQVNKGNGIEVNTREDLVRARALASQVE